MIDEALEHLAFVVDSPPEIVPLTVDLHENLVEMPAPMPEISHRLDPAAPDLGRENRPEPVPPEPHRLVTNVNPAFEQQVLHIAQR